LFALTLAAAAGIAAAQPGKTVRLLVGFPAGGAPDAVARAFADQMRQATGQAVVVENKPGASGKLAIDELRNARADGDTIAVIPASILALTPQVLKSARYDPVNDFVGLGSLAEYGFGVAAGPASGATDIAGYKAWAAKHPKDSNFATPGVGTPQHFLGAQLQKALGVELTHIPYKGGASAVTDVIGGQVALLITTEQLLVPYEGQKLHTLFITSARPNPRMPKVPTAREVGMPQLESTDWFGLFVQAGTPQAKVDEWRAAVAKITASPAYIAAMKNLGFSVPAKQPVDFIEPVKAAVAAWGRRVKLANFNAMD
ncbi:MAG: hypothetical protein KGL43_27605, partial [Burkholderiales bacterium]|nr:hypothetical protein [Burkholderiales bacterium]